VRVRLRDEYQNAARAVETARGVDEDAWGTAMGAIAHTPTTSRVRQRTRVALTPNGGVAVSASIQTMTATSAHPRTRKHSRLTAAQITRI